MTGRWLYPGTSVSSTNKTERHNITEILLNVALNTITHNPPQIGMFKYNIPYLYGSCLHQYLEGISENQLNCFYK